MSADSPRRSARGIPAIVPPQVVSDRSIIDSVAGFINDVTLNNQPQCDPKDTITWARFETAADISDTRYCDDWELEGNVAPPLLLILGYGQGVQVWAIPANGEAVEVLSWRHGIVSALRVLPTPSYAENGRADEPIDAYADKRPLMAICDGTTPAGSNPQFCAVNFVSLKTGAQVKTIKFKNPVLDILANRSSIVITFHERIAVFDARSLEDRLSVTTCFPSPGINPNPVALGTRWMAYSENKLLHSKRSGGGCDGDGVASYTATVLNAAKSFGKGLRELGEQVAAGLTGTTGSSGSSKSSSFDSATGDMRQGGVVTILDIKHPIKDVSPTSGTPVSINGSDPIVAHFIAHSEAVVAMEFDNSGMMLLTADRRGHDFHLFRIQPHPVGSSLAAVHHIYVLHRGDTSAKVQNITFSLDSRWVAVSTLRGTTHVFPVTPYGGPAGARTHTSLHVVNKLSRFHRSAGLTADGRSSSPISHSDSTNFSQILMPYHNPTMPPFPRPTVVLPLAQLRQPFALGSPPGSAVPSSYGKASNTRQRLSSLSDDNGKPLSVCAVFAKSRSWLLDPPNVAREAPHKIQRKAVDSLFVMAGHGALIQYDLDTKLATNVAKEKICDDTPIELEVEAKAQWNLGRKDGSPEIIPPLSAENWLIKDKNSCMLIDSSRQYDDTDDRSDSWLSQVEIITHAGPHRRLWMGPQFVFKTYNTPSGSNLSHIDIEAVEIGVSSGSSSTGRPERSSPLNMPLSATGRSAVPVLIESGSYSSIEQSPKLMDRFRHEHMNSDFSVTHGDNRLKEDLADAMRESPSVSHKDSGGHPQRRRISGAGSSRTTTSPSSSPNSRRSGSGGVLLSAISASTSSTTSSSSAASTLVGGCGVVVDSEFESKYESLESLIQQQQQQQQQQHMKAMSIEKVVNPLGTVTTITGSCESDLDSDDVLKGISAQSYVIHENCDESLFRPVVAIFCDENINLDGEQFAEDSEFTKPPETIGNKLIVPVIEKAVDLELTKKESLKNRGRRQQQPEQIEEVKEESDDEVVKFNIADVKKKQKNDKKKEKSEEREIPKKTSTKTSLASDASSSLSSKSKTKKQFDEKPSVSKMSKTQTEKKYEEFDVIPPPAPDKDFKAKSTKSRKSVEKELVSEDISVKCNTLDIESKPRKSLERDVIPDEVDCTKKPSSDISFKSKTSGKSRKSLEKEILVDKTPLVVDPKPTIEKGEEVDVGKKPKSAPKGRKSVEKEITIAKCSESESPAQKEMISDDLETLESHFDDDQFSPDVKLKSFSRARKSIENEIITLERSPENSSKESSRKSSVVELSFDDDSSTVKKSKKVRKNDEKEMGAIRKSSIESTVSVEEDRSKKTKRERLSEEKKIQETDVKTKSIDPTEDLKNKDKTKKSSEDPKLVEDFEEEKPIEFKRMTTTIAKTVKPEKPTLVKFEAKSSAMKSRAKSPEETDSSENLVTKKKSNKKKPISDIQAGGMPLEVEVPNVSDLADSLLDFKPDNKENVDEFKKKTGDDKLNENSVTLLKENLSEKESRKNLRKLKLDKVPTMSSDICDPHEKANDTIINVEEKEAETLKTKQVSVEKKAVKADSKVTKELSKTDNVLPSSSKVNTSDKFVKLEELPEIPPKSEVETPTKKQITKPDEDESILSELANKSSSSSDSSTKTIESPKKSKGSPLKFVDDNFIAPEIPLKKDKNPKKKQNSVKVSDKLQTTKQEPLVPKACDEIQFFDAFLQEGSSIALPSQENAATPWKPLVKVEGTKTKLLSDDFPSLGKPMKMKKSQSPPMDKTELPPFTIDIRDEKKDAKSFKSRTKILEEISLLEPLDDFLPPLASLDPLEGTDENISLINFESPLQEASKPIKTDSESEKKPSPQFPKGFPADNIIFALCGSLHYENENSGKPIDSPLTLSFSDSTAHTTAEYKSLTENDDQYLSLEQSSQENNPSTSSSTCEDITEAAYSSSGGGGGNGGCAGAEKPSGNFGKSKNKQRRKKQQLITAAQDDDEELRPLICIHDEINLMTSSITTTTTTSPVAKTKTPDMSSSVHETPLPMSSDDNNQANSDSSSSDQALTSEDGQLQQQPQQTSTKNYSNKKPGKSLYDDLDKSAEDDVDMAASSSIQSSSSLLQQQQQAQSQQQQQQQPSSSKKKLKRRKR